MDLHVRRLGASYVPKSTYTEVFVNDGQPFKVKCSVETCGAMTEYLYVSQTYLVFLQTYMPVYTVSCSWTCQSLSFTQLSSMCLPDIIACFPLHLLQRAANGAPRLGLCGMTLAECVMFFSTGIARQISTSGWLYTISLSASLSLGPMRFVYVSAHEVFSCTAVITESVNLPWNANNGLVIHVEWIAGHTVKWNRQWFAY